MNVCQAMSNYHQIKYLLQICVEIQLLYLHYICIENANDLFQKVGDSVLNALLLKNFMEPNVFVYTGN